MSIHADKLREAIIFLMIENAQIEAAVSPLIVAPTLDVDTLGLKFDAALDEINQERVAMKSKPLEVDASFKQAVLDSLMRRMEAQGRIVYQA